jgi:hypothetical protein
MIIVILKNALFLMYHGNIELATHHHDTLGRMLLVTADSSWDCKIWDNIPFSQIAEIIGI